jgi:predicted anti-sigma-YlaC factor YlaD
MSKETLAWTVYWIGDAATFVYLTFFDGYVYNAWNWIIAVPVNMFLAAIWPLYWAIIRWIPLPF